MTDPLVGDLLRRVSVALAADDTAAPAQDGRCRAGRQPVHTCYVPGDRAGTATPREWGEAAHGLAARLAATGRALVAALDGELTPPPGGFEAREAETVRRRVLAKLAQQPIEDLRVDFEDGYGHRRDGEEDAHAEAAGVAIAAMDRDPGGPLLTGVRVKGLQPGTRERGLRTLVRVVGAARVADPWWPRRRVVVTLPKVTSAAQVAAAAEACAAVEVAYGLRPGSLRLELQVEVPQAVVAADGRIPLAGMVEAAVGRCEGLHFGTYDFTAAAGVSGGHQSLDHPLADQAKDLMQLAAAGTGTRVADGSTNVLPVGGDDEVRAAWRLHARLVTRALGRGIYQGWDLHPGQLVSRYAATYAFWRAEVAAAAGRLGDYAAGRQQGVLDEPATARALATTILRGVDCAAVDEAEATAGTGLALADLERLAGR